MLDALRTFHSHVREGFSFQRAAPVLLRVILESPDQRVVSASDALSLFMFLAARDDVAPLTAGLMLRRLSAEKRFADMWMVYQALVAGDQLKGLTPDILNRLLAGLLSADRYEHLNKKLKKNPVTR